MLVAGNVGLLLGEAGGFLYAVIRRKTRILTAVALLASVAFALAYIEFVFQTFLIATPPLKIFGVILGAGALLGAVGKVADPMA